MGLVYKFWHFIRHPELVSGAIFKRKTTWWKEPKNVAIIFCSGFFVFVFSFIFRNQISTFFSSDPGADPVAYWKFDEGQSSTTNDSIGSNNGTLGTGNSAPTWLSKDQCLNGNCLRFDGTNDYVEVNADTSIGDLTSDFTVSAWIKPYTVSGTQRIVSSDREVTGDGFSLGIYNTNLLFTTYAIKDYISTEVTLSPNRWYFVTAVMDSSYDTTFYLDGKEIETITHDAAAVSNTDDVLLFGAGGDSGGFSEFFKGEIDEVKIYPYARNAAQVQADFTSRGSTKGVAVQFGDDDISRKLSNGLVGYWKMDEVGVSGSNWTAADSSGNNYNGAGVDNAGPATGKFGNGGYFDGTSDYVTTGGLSRDFADTSNELTFSTWFKADRLASLVEMISNSSSNGKLGFSSVGGAVLNANIRIDGTTQNITGNTIITTGTWTMATFTVKQGVLKLYVNGILDAENKVSGPGDIDVTAGEFSIAQGTTSSRYFKGTLDETRIYNRALDLSEVKALYNFAPGPIGYWKMDENTGTTANDSSGNGRNGTLTNNPNWTSGRYGSGVSFSGATDYIDVNPILLTDNWSLAFWAKPTNAEAFQGVTGAADGNNAYINLESDQFHFSSGGGGGPHHRIDFTEDLQWHHFTLTRDGDTTYNAYIDGILMDSYTDANGTFYFDDIGRFWNSDDYTFQGSLDEFKIYNYARTSSQIIEDMNAGHPAVGTPVGSTVLHLKMNEGYGDNIQDSSPLDNDANLAASGTCPGSSACPTWTNDGKFGKALSFDGNDYATIPDSESLSIIGDMTISAWVNPSSAGTIVSKTDSTQQSYEFQTAHSNCSNKPYLRLTATLTSSIFYQCGKTTLPTNQWAHIVAVFKAGEYGKIYLNGVDDTGLTNGTAPPSIANSTQPLGIGGGFNGDSIPNSDIFTGRIDELKIYPFALSAEQVKVDYNQGKTQVMGANSTGVGGTSPSNSASREYCVPGDSSTCDSPKLEYTFDSLIGNTVPDTSTTGNNGSLVNGPVQTKGKFGQSLEFDGTNDYVNMGDLSFTENASQVTWSFWIKPKTWNMDRYMLIKSNSTATDLSWIINHSNTTLGRIVIITPTFSNDSATLGYADNVLTGTDWKHISVVFDGTLTGNANRLKLFVNGSQVAMQLNGTIPATLRAINGDATVGGLSFASGYSVNAYMDTLRIYDYARTAAQIAWEYNRGAPIAHYQFNECTGTTAYNAARTGGNKSVGSNGTITIGASGSQTSAGTCSSGNTAHAWNNGTTGKLGASLSFDGTDDYVTITDPGTDSMLDFGTSEPISISMWVKPDSILSGFNYQTILAKGLTDASGEDLNYSISLGNTSDISFCFSDSSDAYHCYNSSNSVTSSEWQYITVSHTFGAASSTRVFVNGALKNGSWNSGNGSALPNITNEPLWIGAINISGGDGSEEEFDGQIDEVKIYNYAVTSQQIKTEMTGAAVRFE